MNLDRVTSGSNLPDDFNVIVEIPMNADPIKYEVDKETGALFVRGFLRCSGIGSIGWRMEQSGPF